VLPDLAEPVTETCRRAGIPLSLTSTRDVNTEEVAHLLAESGAQIVLYSGIGGQIVSERILRVGPRFLHLHSGWLPEYRGSTTLYYALLNGDAPGVTAIFLDPGIDTGPILARRHYPKPPSWMDVDLAYDSAIRADLLCDLMERHAAAGRLDVTDVQSVGEGRTYFVIHPVLKHIALLSIGKRSND
jgi:methionyl-tRNA formyltransferase